MLYSNKYIFWDKVVNRVLHKKNVVWSKVSPIRISQILLGNKGCSYTHLRQLLNRSLGEISNINLSEIKDEDKEKILFNANQTIEHKYDYLGSGWTEISPMDWHTDFISGHTWFPGTFYANYVRANVNGGFDVKVVWELSRCHHLLWLAEAYSITKDRRYSHEVICQIIDWIDNNPLMRSINWTCSMDVAIRAINWMYALAIIIDSGDVDDNFAEKIYVSLFQHSFFIVNNLEKTIPYSGNHYLSDLTGLLFICSLFPNNYFAKKWFKFALNEFKREALIELSNDGTDYEHSISYHRLVSELFIYSYALLRRQKYQFSLEIEQRFEKMIEYIDAYTKLSGLSPLIGDNDNGRLLPFTPRDFRKHGYMCSIGRALWGNSYNNSERITAESLYASFGISELSSQNNSLPKNKSILFPDNKLAIVKEKEIELYVTNSPFSLGRCEQSGLSGGTHTHPDALSFDLSFAGVDFIVDAGTYVYTSNPTLRNDLRATSNHNTIIVDNNNQTQFASNNVFIQTNFVSDRRLEINCDDDTKFVRGSYKFYNKTLEYKHSRTFKVKSNAIQIKDDVSCVGYHNLLSNFHIAPDIDILVNKSSVTLKSIAGVAEILVKVGGNNIVPEISESLFSPSYGILQKSKSLRYICNMSDNCEIITEILWEKK